MMRIYQKGLNAMRTTVDLDEDVLMAVKELARLKGESIGRVLSELTRKGLLYRMPESSGGLFVAREPAKTEQKTLASLGIHPFPYEGGPIPTNELVNRIREEEGI
jgi:hypothetical protein